MSPLRYVTDRLKVTSLHQLGYLLSNKLVGLVAIISQSLTHAGNHHRDLGILLPAAVEYGFSDVRHEVKAMNFEARLQCLLWVESGRYANATARPMHDPACSATITHSCVEKGSLRVL